MTAKLRKLPYTDAELGLYELSGGLEGLSGPGRRVVRELEVKPLDGDDLSPLAAFPDLRALRIERSRRLDLTTLPSIPGLVLILDGISEVDLAGLSDRDDLAGLRLLGPRECDVPDVLRLPPLLRELTITFDGSHAEPVMMHRLVSAIDWTRLDGLRKLNLRVAVGHPIGIDLSFLASLSQLAWLEVLDDIRHGGPAPSPLEPPFHGLPRGLTHVSFPARKDAPTAAALRDYLDEGRAADTVVAIEPRLGWEPGDPMWEMTEGGYGWEMFGSFALAAARPLVEETAARADAQRRLADADPELADRIEFDPVPPGSALVGESPEDLAMICGVLGLRSDDGASTPQERLLPGASWSVADADARGWQIHSSAEGGWSVYGSLVELLDDEAIYEEYEAVREVQRRLTAADPKLSGQLDFDHESDGTGVYAERREDLQKMLDLLDIQGA